MNTRTRKPMSKGMQWFWVIAICALFAGALVQQIGMEIGNSQKNDNLKNGTDGNCQYAGDEWTGYHIVCQTPGAPPPSVDFQP